MKTSCSHASILPILFRQGRIIALSMSLMLTLPCTSASAADSESQSMGDLARATQNPVADLISVPFQNNTSFEFGPEEKTQNVLNIQPVIPFSASERWNLITRTIVPVVSQPEFTPDQDRENGLGNTLFSGFLSPKASGPWIWGAGPAVQLPTSTDDRLGADEWAAGPSLVVLRMQGPWVYGSLFSNIWELSGREDINFFTWQYFVNYNFDRGWYLTSAPIITADWEADDEWTVPVGGGFGRVFPIGKQPVNASLQAFYNIEKPQDLGPDWSIRAQLQLMFPQ
ncbi:MAG: neuromedin U [Pseudomonadota bacterium]